MPVTFRPPRFAAFAIAGLLAASAAGAAEPILRSDRLVLLSVTDVKGKTGPCGCHVPKGGLSRMASFADSIRSNYGQVVLVDNGGFFPEQTDRSDLATFMMDAYKSLDFAAAGVGERDLAYGLAFLKSEAQRRQFPLTCANLVDRTQKTVAAPYLIQKSGNLRIGFFGLIASNAELGPAKDSLTVLDPTVTAKRIIPELRKKVDVVVLLSQLGKIDTEDLIATLDGLDAVVVGRDTPILQKGRLIKNTVACYGGEQGQYMCETILTLDAKRHVINRDASAVMLSPEVGEKAEVTKMVRSFEDSFAERARKAKEKESATAAPSGGSTP